MGSRQMSTPEFEKLLDELIRARDIIHQPAVIEVHEGRLEEYRAARTAITSYVSKIEEERDAEARVKAGLVNRVNALMTAIAPFVEAAGPHLGSLLELMDGDTVAHYYGPNTGRVTVGDIRRAVTAMSESASAARLSGHPSTKPGEPAHEA